MEDTGYNKEQFIETQNSLDAARKELQQEMSRRHEPIAIVGMAFRFPGNVSNATDLWKLLINGIDGIEDIPASRWDNDALLKAGLINHKQGGFVKDIDLFDGSFFDIAPIELENTEPGQRLLLETTYEAFENAGIDVAALKDSNTAVYAGVFNIDYQVKNYRTTDTSLINTYSYVGNAMAAASGRISYVFGFQGPSMTVDTGCSSSLVAAHLGVQALRNGETDLAVVGAANFLVSPEYSISFSEAGGLSPDARSKAFDNSANGYVRSEGVCTFLLKRLSDAQRENDNILALIKGTAVTTDGRSEHFSVPNNVAQAKAIRAALQNANISPAKITYLEAHGTGTRVGDPIELNGILEVYNGVKSKADPLMIGSVKTNIGHMEAAAGFAGLAKVILSLKNKTIPGNLHFNTPNTLIDWEKAPVKVISKNTEWNTADRHAGLNSFGITGTNAHVIVGEAPAVNTIHEPLRNDIFILPLSARSEQALLDLSKKYADFITNSSYKLEDICAMAALRRTHHEFREVFVAENKDQMIESLNDFHSGGMAESKKVFSGDENIKTVFIFPGQGAQWIRMGRKLMENELVYKAALDEINDVYKNYVDWDLIEEINKNEQQSRLHEIDIVQPVLIAVQIALANLWMSKGVFPDIVVGHSMGEVGAAYVAGNITLHEAAQVIITRSKLMKLVSGKGEMGATDLSIEEANECLKGYEDRLSVAVMNSKNSTVLSGDPHALNEIFARLEAQGRFNRKVKVDVASHSPQMDDIKVQLHQNLQNLQPQNSSVQFFSTAFNEVKNGESLNADYWAANLRNPVQFGNAIQKIAQENNAVYVEMSPHATLLHAINENLQNLPGGKETKAVVTGSFSRDKNEQVEFYINYTNLYTANVPFDWKNIYQSIGEFIELPNYAWQKERYWLDIQPAATVKASAATKATDSSLYGLSWEEVDINSSVVPKRILIIKDTYGYYKEIESALAQKDCAVSSIDFQDALDGIEADIVIHLRSLYKDELFSYYYECGVDSIQRLTKYFAGKKQTKIVVVTNGANVLPGDKKANLNASLLTGLIRTIQNEYTNISFHQVDISNEINAYEIAALPSLAFADNIYKELANRNGKNFAATISPSPLPVQTRNISADASYIVTGGNNGVGLETVKWLIGKGAKHIDIISRSGIKKDAENAIKDLVANTDIKIGAYMADVAKMEHLKAVVDTIKSQRQIKGVFHAAGILDDALFEDLTKEKFGNTLSAKANGAWNLHQLFSEDTLDIFAVYSSVAGILGSAGQSNYAAANTFLDALIQYRRNHQLAGISVNWGTIGDVGLAAQQENRGNRLAEWGLKSIPAKELSQYFDKLFLSDASQVMAMDIDFNKWAESSPKISSNYFYSKVLSAKTEEAVEKKSVPYTNVPSAIKYLKQKIKQVISSVTKINVQKIKEEDTFKSYGIDSLLALQIKNKLQKDLDVQLNVSLIWSHPTVSKLTDFLLKELKIEEQLAAGNGVAEEKGSAVETAPAKTSVEVEVESLSLDDLLKQLNEKVN
jgi:acyl transferase domain-containing protein/acyl carrier protein